MKKSMRIGALVAVAALTGALVACAPTSEGRGADNGSEIKKGGVIRVGSWVPRAAPDPKTVSDPGSNMVIQPVLEYLLTVENDGSISPQLATDYKTEDGGLTWQMDIREEVTFHDGTDFTAADVKATFDRIVAKDSVSGAKSAFDGILSPGGIEQVDDHAVVFNLDHAFADFPFLVSSANYPAVVTKADYKDDFLTNPVGTGPFVMDSYNPSTGANYTAYKDYWNAKEVYLDGIEIKFFADISGYTGALLSGAIDAAAGITYYANGPLYESKAVELHTSEVSLGTLIHMRTDQGPFEDVRVREAMALSVDRKALALAGYGPLANVGNDTLWTSQFPEKVDIPQRTRDLDRAAELLAEAGHPNGLAVTLTAPSLMSPIGELVQSQANEAGFKVTLEVMDTNQYYANPWLNVDFGISGWAARASVSQIINMLYKSGAKWNTAHWSNDEFDELADELAVTVDQADRDALAQRLDEILHEEIPQIVTGISVPTQATTPRVQGYKASQFHFIGFVGLWLNN